MKKLLLIAILMLALVFTIVACNNNPAGNDTTVDDTTVETPTDAPTEEPTDAPTEDPTDTPTEAPTDEPTEAPTDEPTPEPDTEPTVKLDRTEYLPGEPIMISATGSGKDWVGIVIAGTDYSIRWWYVEAVGSGVAIDVLNDSHIQAGTGDARGELPAGDYEVVWVANDSTIVDAEKAYRYKFTITDPHAPVAMFNHEAVGNVVSPGRDMQNGTVSIEDGYVNVVPGGADPFWFPFGSFNGARYIAIRYRTSTATGADIQFYMASTGTAPSDDTSMMRQPLKVDGDWHVALFDTQPLIDAGIYDGSYVSYFRFDPLESGYKLDENGQPYKDEDDRWVRHPLPEGSTIDIAYVGFFNSPEDAAKYDFEKYPPYLDSDDPAAGKIANSFDTFYVNGQMYFPEDGGAGDKLTAQNNTVSFAMGEAHDSMILRGWVGFGQPIVSFGYYLDNYEFVFNPDYTKPTEQGVLDAGGEFASRYEILVPLAHLKTNDHFAGFVALMEDGTVIRLRADITVDLPDDISDTFISDVASNEDGTDLQASDLANFFTIVYGAADPHVVSGGMYQYGGINEMFADVDGSYAFTINMLEAANTAMMFVRGTHVVHSVDLPAVDGNLYPINNYYETDGQGRMGGAGVYAALYNGRLNLMIKAYDDAARTHQINREYSIVADGTALTIADDGQTLYFLVDGKLLATVALSGSTSYEKICDLAEGITFAQTAVVTLADGTTDTIENTLVVATVQSQLGIALRPAAMKFDSIKVEGFADVEIPAEFYVPEVKENVALNKPVSADSVENENNIPSNATDGDDATRWGALPNGAANLIVDLEEVMTLVGMDVLFENAGWKYQIAISEDDVDYTVIHESEAHAGKMVKLEGEVNARYIKFSRLDDSADTSAPHWFSIYEVLVYAKAEEEPEEPVVPDEPTP